MLFNVVDEKGLADYNSAPFNYQDYSPQAFQLQYGIFRDVLRATLPPG
jgi:hypothetical protein